GLTVDFKGEHTQSFWVLRPLPPVWRVPRGNGEASATQLHHTFPGIHTSAQRTHLRNSIGFEEQRRTGAGGFVWSTAYKNDLAIAGDLRLPGGQLLDGEPDRTRDGIRIVLQAAAEVHNVQIFSGIHAVQQFLRADAGHLELIEISPALDELPE